MSAEWVAAVLIVLATSVALALSLVWFALSLRGTERWQHEFNEWMRGDKSGPMPRL